MHPIIVSVIVGLIFVIYSIIVDNIFGLYDCKICDMSQSTQYLITFLMIFAFNMIIEYTELNDLICSGNH